MTPRTIPEDITDDDSDGVSEEDSDGENAVEGSGV